MAISDELLDILACPLSKKPLRRLPNDTVLALNELIVDGRLRLIDGSPVLRPMTEALLATETDCIYMVLDGIPIMMPDERIPLQQIRHLMPGNNEARTGKSSNKE